MNKKKISIVVCAFNELEYTIESLNSLIDNTINNNDFSYKFSLYDDCSTDNTKDYIKSNFKQIFYHRENQNKGFNNLCNVAYKQNTDSDYLLILNNDLKFSKDWANHLLNEMIKEGALAAGPITNAPGHQPKQNIINFVNSYKLSDDQNEINEVAKSLIHKKSIRVSYLNGFCMAFNMNWLRSLDKPVFKYEDPNFGLETFFFKKNNPEPKPLVVPSSFVFHYKQVTVKKNPFSSKSNLKEQQFRIFREGSQEKIAIGVITYNRKKYLKKCLASLLVQSYKHSFDIIVVDNEKNKSAKEIVDSITTPKNIKIIYDVEIERGIPFARNKVVEMVVSKYDYLAFIDDDEIADKYWLDNLYNSIYKLNADVVSGPVITLFKGEIPSWILNGKFLRTNKKKNRTGDVRKVCYTNNVLMKVELFKKYNKPFHESFQYSGGSDSHFFKQLYKDGYVIKWSNEAVAYEHALKKRLTLKWNLLRIFRVGNCSAISLKINKEYKEIYLNFIKSIFRVIISLILINLSFIPLLFGYNKFFIRRIRRLSKSFGFIFGVLGYKYLEYK